MINVYNLGQDGQGMNSIASVSQNSVVFAVRNIARTVDHSLEE